MAQGVYKNGCGKKIIPCFSQSLYPINGVLNCTAWSVYSGLIIIIPSHVTTISFVNPTKVQIMVC